MPMHVKPKFTYSYLAQNCQMRKTATLGVGVTLNQPCCYGYQSLGSNIPLDLFSIFHYLGQLLPNLGLLLQTLSA